MKKTPTSSVVPGFRTGGRLAITALSLATLALAHTASAQTTTTWSGGGGDNNWGTGANWGGSPPPVGTTSDLVFAGTTRTNPFNNYTAFDDFRNIFFASGAGTFSITGNAIDLFGKIENNSTNTQTFALDLGVNTSFIEINPVSGNLNINSANIFLNANQLRIFGNNGNTLTFGTGTIISGTGGSVAINQNSTVLYQSAHTYTGDTFINAGVLRFGAGSSANNSTIRLGDTTGTNNATLQVASGVTLTNGTIEVRSGSSGTKTFGYTNASGTGVIGRTVTLNAGATADVASGGTLSFAAVVSGGSGLTKSGSGLLNLLGANTFSGGFTLNDGSVRISANSVVTAGSVTSGSVGTGTLTINGGRLLPGGAGGLAVPTMLVNSNFSVNSGVYSTTDNGRLSFNGVMNLQGGTRTITLGRWTNALGTLASGQESFRFNSNNALAATITNGTARFVRDTNGTASDYVGLTFNAGTVVGAGAGITIGSNVVTVMADNPWGTSNVPILSVEAGGIFNLSTDTAARSARVQSLSGAGLVTSLANAAAPATSTLTISNASSADSSTFSGQIIDGNLLNATLGTSAANVVVALTKAGAGTQTLAGSNNYSGATTISGGALRAANANALGSTVAGTTVSTGGALELSNGITVAGESLTLNGDGISAGGALRNISGNNAWTGSISNNSNARINSDSGTLTISGNVNSLATQSLFVGGAGNTTIDGLLTASLSTGNGALYKDGAGVLTLSANNTGLTGLVRLLGGTISVTNVNSLGSGTLELGALATQGVLLVNSGGSRSANLLITDGTTNSVINVASGQVLTNSGNVTGGGNNATKFGKAGAGTLLLSGTGSTYGGQIQIGNGTVVIGNTGALGTNITTTTRGIDLGLNINDANEPNNVALLLSNGVTLSNSIYVSPNVVNTTNYTRTIGVSGTGAATITNQIFLDGNLTTDAGANSTLTLSGNLTNTGGVIKTGSGTLVLSGVNTYTGKTVISDGTISVGALPGLGVAPGSFVSDQLTISNGGRLLSTGSFTHATNRGITVGAGGGFIGVAAGQNLQITNNTNGQAGIITGSGSLTKVGSGILTMRGSNTLSGGFVLAEGVLRLGSSTVISGGNLSSGALGTGDLTISNGTVIQGGGNSAYFTNIFVKGDFAVNTNVYSSSGNGRFTLGGRIDLNGTTNTITLGRWTNALGAISGGQESLRFGNDATFNAQYTNGSLRFARDAAGGTNDFVGVNFTTTGQVFAGGGGFIIGSNVITTFGGGGVFTNALGVLPTITVEAGGYLNMGSAGGANSQTIRSLSGTAGTVTALGTNATSTSATLTINAQAGDNASFGGQIVDGSSLTNTLGTVSSNISLAITKTGAGTQVLSGNNTHSGNTTISAGVLTFANTNAKSVNSQVTVQSNAVIGLGVGGAGGYDEATITSIISNTATGYTMNVGSIVGIDTTAGNFDYGANIGNSRELWKLGANTLTLSGGSGRFGATVVTAGTLELNATSGQAAGGTSGITVRSGATLLIAKSDQVNNAAAITLSGGTIAKGSGVSETMGDLTLTAASTLDYGTGTAGTLTFGTYAPSALTKLTLNNFGLANTLRFVGSDLSSFIVGSYSGTSFSNDYFNINGMDFGFTSSWDSGSSTFTITSVPEPSTVLAALGLTGLLGWPVLRRRLRRKA